MKSSCSSGAYLADADTQGAKDLPPVGHVPMGERVVVDGDVLTITLWVS